LREKNKMLNKKISKNTKKNIIKNALNIDKKELLEKLPAQNNNQKQTVNKCNDCVYFGEAMGGSGIGCGFLDFFFIQHYYPGKEIFANDCKHFCSLENDISKQIDKKCKDCEYLSKELSHDICSENYMIISSLETTPKWCKYNLALIKNEV